MTETCTPGQRLGLVTEFEPGAGTYVAGSFVCASLVGIQRTVPVEETADKQRLPRLEVSRSTRPDPVPSPGDVVTARITRLTPRLALADILCVGEHPCAQRYSGVVRIQDVRATEIDSVRLPAAFRPGDLIRAEVLSLGDARSYFLTTAKNELGVVYAKSIAAGVPMVPLSWQEMQCPTTQSVESRKVARV
ncbi:CSL4 [Auxenochlorella protothecoides x Auxenochlorella symbiontica]